MSVLNRAINKLGAELHIPTYQYCGPGTKLEKRLARGDTGIDPLDQACKDHDIVYNTHSDLPERHKADKVLADKAWRRFKSKDASLKERLAALAVTAAMKTKVKLGMGSSKKRQIKSKTGKGVLQRRKIKSGSTSLPKRHSLKKPRTGKGASQSTSFPNFVKNVAKVVNAIPANSKKALINAALEHANSLKPKKLPLPKVIPLPKKGGFLPFLIPLFAGLSAAGALGSAASSIATAVNKAKQGEKALDEAKRHNQTMEAIAVGKGLYMAPYRSGCGLYLNPYRAGCGIQPIRQRKRQRQQRVKKN